MKRREFLAVSGRGSGERFVGSTGRGDADARAGREKRQGGPRAPPGGQAQGRRPGRGRGPAAVPPAKLARVSLMTLNFDPYIRDPGNATPGPEQTLTIFDLPKMYVDMYGVHNIEYQHSAHHAVGDRSGVHQGAEGEARREQDDDDADQPGVRRSEHLDARTRRCARRRSIARRSGSTSPSVGLPARDDQPAAGTTSPRRRGRTPSRPGRRWPTTARRRT